MTKIRPLNTAEQALDMALDIVPIKKIAHAIGKPNTTVIAKWADEREDNHHISVQRAMIVDKLCIDANGCAPFYELFRQQYNALKVPAAAIMENLVATQAELGDVCREILAALGENSDGGKNMSKAERQKVLFSILELSGRLARLQSAVESSGE